jgi:hypothetical protein
LACSSALWLSRRDAIRSSLALSRCCPARTATAAVIRATRTGDCNAISARCSADTGTKHRLQVPVLGRHPWNAGHHPTWWLRSSDRCRREVIARVRPAQLRGRPASPQRDRRGPLPTRPRRRSDAHRLGKQLPPAPAALDRLRDARADVASPRSRHLGRRPCSAWNSRTAARAWSREARRAPCGLDDDARGRVAAASFALRLDCVTLTRLRPPAEVASDPRRPTSQPRTRVGAPVQIRGGARAGAPWHPAGRR